VAVVWSEEGADDFLSALKYLRERNPVAAGRLSRRVDDTLQRLDELPLDGPEVELGEGVVVRTGPIALQMRVATVTRWTEVAGFAILLIAVIVALIWRRRRDLQRAG
jgi:plasmid stabilization system protein ParE